MWKLLTHNWNLKLTALVLAIVLWSHVRGEINPLETGVFRVPLNATLPREVLITRGKVPAWVQVTLRAPRQTLRELRETGTNPAAAISNPLAPVPPSTLHSEDVRAELDFGNGNTAPLSGAVTIPVHADCQLPDVQVVSTDPPGISLQLDRAAQLSCPVQTQVEVNPDLVVQVAAVSPPQVTLYGPSETLKKVARVVAPLKAANSDDSRQASLMLRVVDANGREIAGVVSEPLTARVKFAVSERVISKALRLIPVLQGAPASGLKVSKISVTPSRVIVHGPRRVVGHLQSLEVALDVSKATSDTQRKIKLVLPPNVSLAAGKSSPFVEVSARIEAVSEPPTKTREESLLKENASNGARLAHPPGSVQPTASSHLPPPAAE